ncbi:MAG TPA: murein L,D-transpeptidase [Gammaproteobacteria bacterium]|nr:murein L,D-transpeptidase [Gammaproteobacteria bacterium]
MVRTVLAALVCLLALFPALLPASAPRDETWILIDTRELTLSVFRGDHLVRRFENISIGRRGTSIDKRSQDETTPLGEYHVIRIARDSIFHRFYHLDYPTPAQGRRALEAGVISEREERAIERAAREHRIPPQYTALGGSIGIHGVGAGNLRIHEDFNWTEGCVALTNEQLDQLDVYIDIGTRVVIR